jgi:penicillin-binding protein 1B
VSRIRSRSRAPGGLRGLGESLLRHRVAILVGLGLAGLLPVLAFAAWTWSTASRVDLAGVEDVSVVYTAPRLLAAGLSVEAIDLAGTLRRLGYRETAQPPRIAGQFRRDAAAWDIFLRGRDDPLGARPELLVRVELDGGQIRTVSTPDGTPVEIELEPEPLSSLGGGANQIRHPIPLPEIPAHLVEAVLAVEDHRFYQHRGVDVRAVLRALWVNVSRSQLRQGGSTLTQQLVKNLVLTRKRTWDRKLREAGIAFWLEQRYGKAEILETYLNGIYLGQHGSASLYGVGAAAQSYFGKDVARLTLAEAALLAGMIRAPNTYSPVHHPDRARERRDVVLRRLRELGWTDDAKLAQALRERVRVQRGAPARLLAAYFVDYVRVQVEQAVAEGAPTGGLRIYSTLDPVLQRAAEGALSRGLDRLEGQYRHLRRPEPERRLQGALVALDARTGEIRAMVGGRDYGQSQFNRAILARRQPGSAFKPFVYLAALGFGPRGEPPHFTVTSLLEDRPLVLQVGRDTWAPRNYENRYEGTVTVRRALEHSLNSASVWMAEGVGMEAVIRVARDVGLSSPLQPVPALTLGSFEVTAIELAQAYAPFANGGNRVAATGLRHVVDRGGEAVDAGRPAPVPAVRPAEAYLLTSLLRGVIDRGTGAGARALGVTGDVAGKTGTTNEGRDAWFVGYTPALVALVWIGFDEQDVLRLSAGQAALPIWADFMRAAMATVPSNPFPVPPGIAFRDVDPTTGKLATSFCPVVVREVFLETTEPRDPCPDHDPSHLFRSLFRRFLGGG